MDNNKLNNLIKEARRAVDFHERCKNDPTAGQVGAWSDLRDWYESIVRDLAKQETTQ